MTNEELVAEIQAGRDVTENLAQSWEQNRRAVWQQARKYAGYAEMDDLMQESYLVLHRVAKEYDPTKGAGFLSLLLACLPRSLYRYVGQQSALRIPDHERQNIAELDQLEKRFFADHGRYPTNREACRILQISPEVLQRIQRSRMVSNVDSLDRSIDLGDDEVSLMDSVAAPDSALDGVEDKIYHDDLKEALWGAVDALEREQADVIRRRFVADQTLKAAGEANGQTPEWARQTEARALRKLRSGENRRILRPFLDDQIYSAGMQGVGAERFRQTWTSATEREALQRIQANVLSERSDRK